MIRLLQWFLLAALCASCLSGSPCPLVTAETAKELVELAQKGPSIPQAQKEAWLQGQVDPLLNNLMLLARCATEVEFTREIGPSVLETNNDLIGASSGTPSATALVAGANGSSSLLAAFEASPLERTASSDTVTFRADPVKLARFICLLRRIRGQPSVTGDPAGGCPTLALVDRMSFGVTLEGAKRDSVIEERTIRFVVPDQRVAALSLRFRIKDPNNLYAPANAKQLKKRFDCAFRNRPQQQVNRMGESITAARNRASLAIVDAIIRLGAQAEEPANSKGQEALQAQLYQLVAMYFRDVVKGDVGTALTSLNDTYTKAEATVEKAIKELKKGPALTFELIWNRPQQLNQEALDKLGATPASGVLLPKLIFQISPWTKPGSPTLVVDGGVGFFTELRPEMRGAWREWQFGESLTWKISKPKLLVNGEVSIAHRYIRLRQSPFGVRFQVGAPLPTLSADKVNRPGVMNVVQLRYARKLGKSGTVIPFSFGYSNRTDLIAKDHTVFAGVGISFNLDAFFASEITKATQ